MRWQSALSVRSSAPTGPPDGRGVSAAPFAHMKTPYILQPPPTSSAPCNKVRHYNLSERCLVQQSSLSLIWQWSQFRDFWHNFTCLQDAWGREKYIVCGGQNSDNTWIKNSFILRPACHKLELSQWSRSLHHRWVQFTASQKQLSDERENDGEWHEICKACVSLCQQNEAGSQKRRGLLQRFSGHCCPGFLLANKKKFFKNTANWSTLK